MTSMVDIKAAVAAAKAFAASTLEPTRDSQLLLEEVEIGTVSGREVWLITLSHPKPVFNIHDNMANLASGRGRDYKTFSVDSDSGQVLSMKIRELAHAE